MDWLDNSPRRVMVAVLLACLGLLAFGLYLQEVVGLVPCPMCIVQRYALILIAVCAALTGATGKKGLQVTGYVAMVVLGGLGHIPGVILGAVLLAGMPEALRYVAGPLNKLSSGHLDPAILRQLLIALAMIVIMLMRPRGLWPSPEHGKSLQANN